MTEEQLDSRDYSFVSITYPGPVYREVVVGSPHKPEARERAMKLVTELWGEPEDVDVWPRNYIKRARRLFRAGLHD